MGKSNHLRVHSTRKKHGNYYELLAVGTTIITVVIVCTIVLFAPTSKAVDETFGDDPRVNLVGRRVPEECTGNTGDSEIRASEEQKLGTVIRLITDKDWEHANALFETIFPAYLNTCGKYQYYQSALSLSDNFSGFLAKRETVATRLGVLSALCNQSKTEGK